VTRAKLERREKMIGAKCILKSLDKNVSELKGSADESLQVGTHMDCMSMGLDETS
jgi:hypothetical protein